MRDLAVVVVNCTVNHWSELGKDTPRRVALRFCGATGDVPKWQ
jgi:hypothetical protein